MEMNISIMLNFPICEKKRKINIKKVEGSIKVLRKKYHIGDFPYKKIVAVVYILKLSLASLLSCPGQSFTYYIIVKILPTLIFHYF